MPQTICIKLEVKGTLRPCDPKSNAHAQVCAFALDGVKIVGYQRTNEPTNKAFLGVGLNENIFEYL